MDKTSHNENIKKIICEQKSAFKNIQNSLFRIHKTLIVGKKKFSNIL